MSPYQSFAPIERNKLNKVSDHNLGFSLFITDFQRECSLFSARFTNSSKISGWPFTASEKLQNVFISAFTTPSTRSESEQWFTASFDSTCKAHQFDRMNFSNKGLCSDCRLTSKKVNYCGPEAKNTIISVYKNNPNIVSNNYLELTYN